jgi:hypothetical protein
MSKGEGRQEQGQIWKKEARKREKNKEIAGLETKGVCRRSA